MTQNSDETPPRLLSKPILLAGGNPRIPKGDGDAFVQAYIEAMPDWKRDVGRRLDGLVCAALPKVRKAVRWNSPFYGTEERGWFLSYHCYSKYVKVAFLNGSSLHPAPPVGSKDGKARYLHVHEDDRLEEGLLTSWVRQASERPGWTGFS